MSEPVSLSSVMERLLEKYQNMPPELRQELAAEAEAREQERERERVARAAQAIPARYREATTSLELGDHGLYLWGSVGTGKTHSAAGLALQAIRKGLRVQWVTGSAWLAAIRASFSGAPVPATPQELARCDLLVIDDLGSEKPSEWAIEQLLTLVNLVYEREGLLIVTSNLRLRQIAAKLGQRIASRLAEMCEPVEITGEDRRLLAAHARKSGGAE